ncbi:hypothetical protein ABK040_009188 [Willaertia magna]
MKILFDFNGTQIPLIIPSTSSYEEFEEIVKEQLKLNEDNCKFSFTKSIDEISVNNNQSLRDMFDYFNSLHIVKIIDNKTLMYNFIYDGEFKKCEELLHKIDINDFIYPVFGWTALYTAVHCRNLELVKLFLNNGADINLQNKQGWTPLYCAVYNSDIEMIRYLLENGANVDLQNIEGWSPLFRAINDEENDIIQLLLENLADPNLQENDGSSPLLHAVQNRNLDLVKNLLSYILIDVNLTDQNGWSPLLSAVRNEDLLMVELLLENNADVNLAANDGNSPLFWSVYYSPCKIEIVNLLLKKGADVDKKTANGWTPLMRAVHNNDVKVLKLLLENNADVNLMNDDSETPLTIAVDNSNNVIVEILLAKGADVEITDPKSGKTIRQLAEEKGIDITEIENKILESKTSLADFLEEEYSTANYIAQGAFGKVYKCIKHINDEIVALKIIEGSSLDPSRNNDSLKEAMRTASLQHLNIVKVFNVKMFGSKYLGIEMEFLRIGDLRQVFLKDFKMALPEIYIKQIIYQISSALDYIHQQDIIHRDIKPENIMIRHFDVNNEEIECVITDFGLAKDSNQSFISFSGTLSYLAPECLSEDNYIFSNKSDIFALGVTIYRLMSGDNGSDLGQASLHRSKEDYINYILNRINEDYYSKEMMTLLLNMLDKDLEKRFSAQEVLQALENNF